MSVYIYKGDFYCENCSCADMIGPLGKGELESDSPTHCAECGEFLENPLTVRGRSHVCDLILKYETEGKGDEIVLEEWRDFYDITESEIYGSVKSPYQRIWRLYERNSN